MKKKLLYLTSVLLFSISALNAQTKSWTFDDTSVWPTAGVASGGPAVVRDMLGCVPITGTSTNYFAAQTTTAIAYSDGTSCTSIVKTGGSGAATNNMPTVRYFYFDVDGAATVKVWFQHGSSATSTDRTLFLTNGTTEITRTLVAGAIKGILQGTSTVAGRLYLYADNGMYISKIEVTGANVTTPALATKSFQKELDVTVFTKQNKIFFSNIKSSTKVEVYNVLGALVKSAKADSDTSLDITNGVYIVKAKSADGEKAVKVIVQ